MLHAHAAIWKERGHLTTQESPVKYSDQILRLLEAVHLPAEVPVSPVKNTKKGSRKWHEGTKQLIRQLKAVLHNHDQIGVATLVPQTDLPETPSCTECETLKAKSEGFQEDHYGVVAQEGTPFSAWKPPVEVR